jgi:hypothetical protein
MTVLAVVKMVRKAIPVTGYADPWGLATDGGKVVSLMRRPPFTPRKISGIHFC